MASRRRRNSNEFNHLSRQKLKQNRMEQTADLVNSYKLPNILRDGSTENSQDNKHSGHQRRNFASRSHAYPNHH